MNITTSPFMPLWEYEPLLNTTTTTQHNKSRFTVYLSLQPWHPREMLGSHGLGATGHKRGWPAIMPHLGMNLQNRPMWSAPHPMGKMSPGRWSTYTRATIRHIHTTWSMCEKENTINGSQALETCTPPPLGCKFRVPVQRMVCNTVP